MKRTWGLPRAVLFLAIGSTHPVFGAPAADRAASLAAKAAFVFQAQETRNAMLESMDDDLIVQRKRADTLSLQVVSLKTQLKQLVSGASAGREEAHRLNVQLAKANEEVTSAQEAFESALARKDQDYARQLNSLRSAADLILSTPDGLRALELNNAGDWEGVKLIEAQLRSLRQQERRKADAADARAFAVLAIDNAAKGRETAAAIVNRLEEVTSLDPTEFDDWSKLTAFYTITNNLPGAIRSSGNEVKLASSDAQRAEAFSDLGSAEREQGDLKAAQKQYEDGLVAARKNLAVLPTDHLAKRQVIDALDDLGDVLAQQGQLNPALADYVEAADVGKSLLSNPPVIFSDLISAYTATENIVKLWMQVPGTPDPTHPASLLVSEVRTAISSHPEFLWLRASLGDSLELLGRAQFAQGDLKSARSSLQEALASERAVLAKDDTITAAKEDSAEILITFAQLQQHEHDLKGAANSLEEALDILRGLALGGPMISDDAQKVTTANARLSELRLALGDVRGAKQASSEALKTGRSLVGRDPETLANRIALSAALCADAMAEAQGGERAKALEELSEAGSFIYGTLTFDQIHQLFAVGRNTALLGSSEISWSKLLNALEALQKSGKLAKSDDWMIDDARRHMAMDNPKP